LRSLGCSAEGAERPFCAALDIAEQQGALLLKLRASTSLARFRCDQGKRSETRDLLAPIYGSFTEGLDMPDLNEAARGTKPIGPGLKLLT
jgi:predicted ATPase